MPSNISATRSVCAEPFFAVLAALGKTDLFRTHEVPRIKAMLDTLRFSGRAAGCKKRRTQFRVF